MYMASVQQTRPKRLDVQQVKTKFKCCVFCFLIILCAFVLGHIWCVSHASHNDLISNQLWSHISLESIQSFVFSWFTIFVFWCCRKGDLLTPNDVRSVIITYVKTNELVHSDNKKWVCWQNLLACKPTSKLIHVTKISPDSGA